LADRAQVIDQMEYRGIPYQTLISKVIHKYVSGYSPETPRESFIFIIPREKVPPIFGKEGA